MGNIKCPICDRIFRGGDEVVDVEHETVEYNDDNSKIRYVKQDTEKVHKWCLYSRRSKLGYGDNGLDI